MTRTQRIAPAMAIALTAGHAHADDIAFDKNGSGNFFIAQHWDPDVVPDADDTAIVNNGGLAIADGLSPGAPLDLILDQLILADLDGDGSALFRFLDSLTLSQSGNSVLIADPANTPSTGTFDMHADLTISHVDAVSVDQNFCFIEPTTTGSANVTATGTALLEDIERFIIGNDLDIANGIVTSAVSAGDAAMTADGDLTMRRIHTVFVDDNFCLADGEISSSIVGAVTSSQTATFLAEDITNFAIGDDLDLGPIETFADTADITVDVHATFRNIDSLFVDDEVDFSESLASDPTSSTTVDYHARSRSRTSRTPSSTTTSTSTPHRVSSPRSNAPSPPPSTSTTPTSSSTTTSNSARSTSTATPTTTSPTVPSPPPSTPTPPPSSSSTTSTSPGQAAPTSTRSNRPPSTSTTAPTPPPRTSTSATTARSSSTSTGSTAPPSTPPKQATPAATPHSTSRRPSPTPSPSPPTTTTASACSPPSLSVRAPA